jgi:hypothetical protein
MIFRALAVFLTAFQTRIVLHCSAIRGMRNGFFTLPEREFDDCVDFRVKTIGISMLPRGVGGIEPNRARFFLGGPVSGFSEAIAFAIHFQDMDAVGQSDE